MKTLCSLATLGMLFLLPIATASAQVPSLSPIVDVAVNAGTSATVNVVAVDPGGRQITLTSSLPSFATLNSPTIGTGMVVTTLTLTPSDIHVGEYTAAVTATSDGGSDLEIFRITVNAAGSPRAPVVNAPAVQQVTAGSNLGFAVSVSDPDGGGIASLDASPLPSGATFTVNASNSSGTFNWMPSADDAGEYDIRFTAMSVNGLAGGAVTHLRVASAPGLAIDPIDDVSVADGSTVSVSVHASGPAGASIALTASLPTFATLNPPGSGIGSVSTTITVAPPTGSAGTYHASVTAISEDGSVTELFDIIVTGTGGGDNHAPILSAPVARSVDVGASLSFNVTAIDPDGDHVDLFGSALPPGAAFVDHGDNTGSFAWTPTSAGIYTASFSGLDNRGGSGSASTEITVIGNPPENHAPILTAPVSRTIAAGSSLVFDVSATDLDGDHVDLFGSALPPGATFVDRGDNTGSFAWTPTSGQAGNYTASFSGLDNRGGSGSASTEITVTGNPPENHAPILTAPVSRTISEGSNLTFDVSAIDPDGDHVDLFGSALPPGATFVDRGDNTGSFAWTPTSGQAGNYTASFSGLDNRGGSGSASTEITVTGGPVENRAPTLTVPATVQVEEGAALTFEVTASDPDGDHVTLTVSALPFGAAFSDQGNNTGLFSWMPSSMQSGVYDLSFTGNDGRGGIGSATTTITVREGGGGEPEVVPGAACMLARFRPRSETTCFRIKPVHDSFDPREVVLTSITLRFRDRSIEALDGARIEVACERDGRDQDKVSLGDDRDIPADGDHDDDGNDHDHGRNCGVICQDCDNRGHHYGHDRDHDDRGHHYGHDCDDDSRDHHDCDHGNHHGHHCNCDHDGDPGHIDCDTLGIRVCFSTNTLIDLFSGASLPCDLRRAEIHATLTTGGTLVATFNRHGHGHDDGDDGDDDGDDDDPGDDDSGNTMVLASNNARGIQNPGLKARISPNPFNPRTQLSFTTSREGTVRVTIYDLHGRVVKTLLNAIRTSGEQTVGWDGSNSHNQSMPSGLYFIRIQTPDGETIRKVAMVK